MESLIRAVLALICLSTIYVSPANSSTDLSSLSEGLDQAVSWLASKQNDDGSFRESTNIAMQWQVDHITPRRSQLNWPALAHKKLNC